MKLSGAILILTCKCEQASQFTCESLDRPLSFSERGAARLHALICRNCNRMERQIRWLHRTLAEMPLEMREQMIERVCRLSPATKQRIKQQLRRLSTDEGA
jgi:hypothetical protein